LTYKEFVDVVAFAPSTRPGRFTILEHLDLDTLGLSAAVEEYVDAIR
jgi:glycerol-1-phosphate dehydrogenase [NAD(P)+]